jgi:transcription initiation factor TFIIIB Brf1 subunit/transcription initiation factor TFIIB
MATINNAINNSISPPSPPLTMSLSLSTSLDEDENNISYSKNNIVDSGDNVFCDGYGEWGHVITHTERTILPDLKQFSFPDEIKNQADVIYNKMIYRVRRGKIRYQMLFFCTYCAHLELGRNVDPIQLGSVFGLTPGEVQRCDSIFSPLQTNYRPPIVRTSPVRYLPNYCNKMGISDDALDEALKLAATILRKDPTLLQENPQTVAAGLLRYYITINGITNDDPQKITKVTGRSNVTIEGVYRRIDIIHNSEDNDQHF